MPLSPNEVAAIAAYTGAAYRAINDQLREDGPLEPMIVQQIEHRDRAVSSSSIPTAMTVYRGIGEKYATELAEQGLAVGDILLDKGFLSASRSLDLAAAFLRGPDGMLLAIRIPVGAKALDIAPFSAYPGEEEILLARESRLRVRGYDAVADILELELLGDG